MSKYYKQQVKEPLLRKKKWQILYPFHFPIFFTLNAAQWNPRVELNYRSSGLSFFVEILKFYRNEILNHCEKLDSEDIRQCPRSDTG